MKKALSQLPKGYKLYDRVDWKNNRKLSRSFTISANVIVVVLTVIGIILNGYYRDLTTPLWFRLTMLAIGFAASVIYIDIHQFIHAVMIYLFSGKRAIFKRNAIFTEAQASDRFFFRYQYVLIMLAPMLIMGVTLTVLCIVLPPKFFVIAFIPACVNICSSFVDFYLTNKACRIPAVGLVNDSGTCMSFFVPYEVYNAIKLDFKFKLFDSRDRAKIKESKSPSDVVNLKEVDAFTETAWDADFDSLPELNYLAMHNGHAVGMIVCYGGNVQTENGAAYVICMKMFFAPDYENKGVARALMKNVFPLAKKRAGVQAIFSYGYDDFYKPFGFVKCSDYAIRVNGISFLKHISGVLNVCVISKNFLRSVHALVEDITEDEFVQFKNKFTDYYRERAQVNGKFHYILGIKVEGEVIAAIEASSSYGNTITIDSIYVDENFKLRGYGRLLINSLELKAESDGVSLLRAEVYSNEGSLFFKSVGYNMVGHYVNASSNFEEYFFVKKLNIPTK